ncbi:hypothetical protein GCM10007199_38890 [Fictibacillus barbaricus]|nr:hypothetical protein GCM10007199_38890 [Fictibacillus barbaricus]
MKNNVFNIVVNYIIFIVINIKKDDINKNAVINIFVLHNNIKTMLLYMKIDTIPITIYLQHLLKIKLIIYLIWLFILTTSILLFLTL